MLTSLDSAFFDDVYAETDDPWNFAGSAYERDKYAASIEALPQERFENGLEIGCSIGILTRQIASRCASLLAVDINDRALAAAVKRCTDLENVTFSKMAVPAEFPRGAFDLVVVSEVAYYWSGSDLRKAIDAIASGAHDGTLLLVHYLPKVAEYPSDGDAVHEAFLADHRFTSILARRADLYRIDVLHIA